jgi:hypothetical protein
MKKYFLLVLVFISCFAQDATNDKNKDTKNGKKKGDVLQVDFPESVLNIAKKGK